MLQETYDRIVPQIPPRNIFVITNWQYVDDVQAQLPYVPADQVIGEPEGRGTAPPAALAALLLHERDPDAITLILPADHVIHDAAAFRRALLAAAQLAQKNYLVTLGITPTFPETGYGYIQAAEEIEGANGLKAFRVGQFHEKPNLETAIEFLAGGNYFWNSGIFIWRADKILAEFAQHLPKMCSQIIALVANGFDALAFADDWHALQNVTIDYGIMEKAEHVALIPLDAGWNDVGSWAALYDLMEHDDSNNVVHGEHIGLNTQSSLIYSNRRLIATIGLENVIIVDTDDALLICSKDHAQDVKKIVDELKKRNAREYL